jgi:hypothetical protein
MVNARKALTIAVVLGLSACSFLDLKSRLENNMSGKDLKARLTILEEACTTHARNHHGREIKNSDPIKYVLTGVCHDMGTKITEASSASTPEERKTFSGLVAQCLEEGKYSLFNKDQQGTKNSTFHHFEDERNFAQDTQAICSLYQDEFDKATMRGAR